MPSVLYFLRALRLRNTIASKPLLEEILKFAPITEVRLEALRTLSSVEGRPESNESAVDPIDLFSAFGYNPPESVVIEPRYLADIVDGNRTAGLEVK